jgi:hypothetical protein
MNVVLKGLMDPVEWQCAHTAYLEFLQDSPDDRTTYTFEGPDGDEMSFCVAFGNDGIEIRRTA